MKPMLICWFLLLLPIGHLLAGSAAKAPKEPVNLNTATATELMQLPRVGAKTAARILDYRKAHGPFQRPEEIMLVKGIGEKAFLRLKPHIRTREPERPEADFHDHESKGQASPTLSTPR